MVQAKSKQIDVAEFPIEVVEISRLKPHPMNYRRHPPDEIAHIKASISENGVYRNVVVAADYTLLAGHGVIMAMTELGRTHAPVRHMDYPPDDPRAIKLLAGDNEIAGLAETDEKLLAELLSVVMREAPGGLTGTGYDAATLTSLLEQGSAPVEFPEWKEDAANGLTLVARWTLRFGIGSESKVRDALTALKSTVLDLEWKEDTAV